MKIYYLFSLVLIAVYSLLIGVKVVLTKRPIFMPSRYFLALMVLLFLPFFIDTVISLAGNSPNHVGGTRYVTSIMFACLLVFFWFQMKGYMAVGVTSDSFREALRFSLDTIGLPYEEQLSVIKLTSINASLHVAIQSWVGAGQLKLHNTNDAKLLSLIVKGIKEYYLENNVRPNYITAGFYILIGVFTAVSAVCHICSSGSIFWR